MNQVIIQNISKNKKTKSNTYHSLFKKRRYMTCEETNDKMTPSGVFSYRLPVECFLVSKLLKCTMYSYWIRSKMDSVVSEKTSLSIRFAFYVVFTLGCAI